MMQPFELVDASGWLTDHASGNCSVSIQTPIGAAIYLYWHDNPAGPVLYGPVKDAAPRRLRSEIPVCRYCGHGFTGRQPDVSAVPEQGAYHYACFQQASYEDGASRRRASYQVMERALRNLLHDLRILSGDRMGPSGVAWQDIAGTAATNAEVLANQLKQARAGNSYGFLTFPSPEECSIEEDSL